MDDAPKIEWPREIWMAEREEHDQGVVSAVLSEYATVARWEGDKERDRKFHHYVDADIHRDSERYWKARIEALTAERDALAKRAEALEGALKPFAIAIEIANRALGKTADMGHRDAVAKRYIGLVDFTKARAALSPEDHRPDEVKSKPT